MPHLLLRLVIGWAGLLALLVFCVYRWGALQRHRRHLSAMDEVGRRRRARRVA